jgi:hypothetical protein
MKYLGRLFDAAALKEKNAIVGHGTAQPPRAHRRRISYLCGRCHAEKFKSAMQFGTPFKKKPDR